MISISNQRTVISLKLEHDLDNSDQVLNTIASQVQANLPASARLSILGLGDFGANFIRMFKKYFPIYHHYFKYHETYNTFNRSQQDLIKSSQNDFCLVFSPPSEYYSVSPLLSRSKATFIFPFHDSFLDHPKPNSPPILLHLFPFAGTGRFLPVIKDLLKKLYHIHITSGTLPLTDPDYAASFKNSEQVKEQKKSIMNHCQSVLNNRIAELQSGEGYYYHSPPINPNDFPTSTYNTIYLIRDPRDLYVSCYHNHILNPKDFKNKDDIFNNLSKENSFLALFEKGICRKHSNYCNLFPSLEETLDSFQHAVKKENSNFEVIRFEDLHSKANDTYKKLLTKYDFFSEKTRSTLTDESLDESISLGSFKTQTKGILERGNKGNVFVSGCRKGVTGDWKNHFTPLIKKKFKEIAGEALIRLGYEKDHDW